MFTSVCGGVCGEKCWCMSLVIFRRMLCNCVGFSLNAEAMAVVAQNNSARASTFGKWTKRQADLRVKNKASGRVKQKMHEVLGTMTGPFHEDHSPVWAKVVDEN